MFFFFFFNDTATTEIYTLSLHDALPIYRVVAIAYYVYHTQGGAGVTTSELVDAYARARVKRPQNYPDVIAGDRKSTRLNSSHANISYAVFCLKKKKKQRQP